MLQNISYYLKTISISSCLLFSSVSIGHSQTLFPRTQLAVFDSKDTKVGSVLGMFNDKASPLWVAFTIEGHLVALKVTQDQLKGPDGVEAYYLSQECSGEPHFKHSQIQGGKGMLPTVLIGSPGRTVYVVDDEDVSLIFYPQSQRSTSGACIKVNLLNPIKLRPGKGIINLQEIFTPPYHIR